MTSTLVKRAATVIGATATAGALVLSTPGLADAATYNRGSDSNSFRMVQNGSGDADARSRATDAGRLTVNTEARGGDGAGGPIIGGGGSTQTVASGRAFVRKRVSAASGTYRVVIRYEGLKGNEFDRGNTADARVNRRSTVAYVAQSGGSNRKISRVKQVPEQRGTRTDRIFLNIPRGSSGFLRITAAVGGRATADGSNNRARANVSASDVDFIVTRVR